MTEAKSLDLVDNLHTWVVVVYSLDDTQVAVVVACRLEDTQVVDECSQAFVSDIDTDTGSIVGADILADGLVTCYGKTDLNTFGLNNHCYTF